MMTATDDRRDAMQGLKALPKHDEGEEGHEPRDRDAQVRRGVADDLRRLVQRAEHRRPARGKTHEADGERERDDEATLDGARHGFVVLGAHCLRDDRVERHQRADAEHRDVIEIKISERHGCEHARADTRPP